MLRFAVPAVGIVVFGGLMLQLFLVNLVDQFDFSGISIDRNNLVVDTPSYSSMGADGTAYQMQAASARAALDRTDVIELDDALLMVGRPDGTQITARAAAARLETGSQTVLVEGTTRIADSNGMQGTVVGLRADFAAEAVTGNGPVDVTFSSGARLEASSMSYDAKAAAWRFSRVTLTLPSLPGEQAAADADAAADPVPQPAGPRPAEASP